MKLLKRQNEEIIFTMKKNFERFRLDVVYRMSICYYVIARRVKKDHHFESILVFCDSNNTSDIECLVIDNVSFLIQAINLQIALHGSFW